MTQPFADPAQPSSIDYTQLQGSLLMIEVTGHEDHIPTVFSQPGERNPAMRCNITVLDGHQAGKAYEDALVFPKVLIGQLRSRVGKLVLGRLGQGEAKTGQTAPWKLEPATAQDRAAAEQFMARAASSAAQGAASPGKPPF
jgi:hypothetical protein